MTKRLDVPHMSRSLLLLPLSKVIYTDWFIYGGITYKMRVAGDITNLMRNNYDGSDNDLNEIFKPINESIADVEYNEYWDDLNLKSKVIVLRQTSTLRGIDR